MVERPNDISVSLYSHFVDREVFQSDATSKKKKIRPRTFSIILGRILPQFRVFLLNQHLQRLTRWSSDQRTRSTPRTSRAGYLLYVRLRLGSKTPKYLWSASDI